VVIEFAHFQHLKIVVAQIGAREHYAAARALHQQGMLASLVTDWYAPGNPAIRWIGETMSRYLGSRGRAALAARTEDIPDELVTAFPFRSMLWKRRVSQLAAQGRPHEAYAETDGAFAAAVARLNLPPHQVFFGYSYASLEMLEAEKKRGALTVLDQIDPGAMEFRLVAEEMARFPELAGPPPEFPTANFDRNRREWELADRIVVNSEWTKQAIVAEGADAQKIEILPLAFEADTEMLEAETLKTEAPTHRPTDPPLRVLFLGQVNVRKGIHYLMEAARLLEREKIHFDIVGPIKVLPATIAGAPRNMTFHGPVSRDRAAAWYRQSDVFVLPTLSDGFALTQLEALAHGLPVIITPNCGRVVEDGKAGFIIPPTNPQALANAILHFVRDPGLAREMASACRRTAKAYSIDAYGQRLASLIEKLSECQ
jgi:glycosyltransferase involved in cell wall biosynthesis